MTEKIKFESGMQRNPSNGKPRFDLIVPHWMPYEEQLLTRWAHLMGRGVIEHGERNWEKASTWPEHDRFVESAHRHFMQWLCGDVDEDHAAAVLFNIQGAEFVGWKLHTEGDLNIARFQNR